MPEDAGIYKYIQRQRTKTFQIMAAPQEEQIVEETLNLHSDLNVVEHKYEDTVPLPRALTTALSDGRVHEIKNFLKRPIPIFNATWTSSSVTNTNLASITLPNQFLLHPMVYQKIRGFYSFKGTAIVTITLNATRFQAGRLMATFFPCFNPNAPTNSNSVRYWNISPSIALSSMLPRIELDAATDSMVRFKVPYKSTELAFNMLSGEGCQGQLDVRVYSPLNVVTGYDGAEFTVFVSYEDVEIQFPSCIGGFQAQAGGIVETSRNKKKSSVDPSDQENLDYGPLSGALASLSTASGYMGRIPMLTSVAAPTQWFLDAMSKSALSFGFSKPLVMKELIGTNPKPALRIANGTGRDWSYNLALAEDNSLGTLPSLGPTQEDEMSLTYIATKMWFNSSVAWSTSEDIGTTVLNYRVGVGNFNIATISTGLTINGNTGANSYSMSPMDWIGSFFTFYRTSIDFCIKFVKTEFHSGRLLFVFQPNMTNSALVSPSIENSNYLYREVIDLRYTNEFRVTVPYVATTPMIPVGQPIGNVWLLVLNELRAPANVSSTVQLLVEFAAHPDIEFSTPRPSPYIPIVQATSAPTLPTSSLQITDTFTPQAGSSDQQQKPVEIQATGNADFFATSDAPYDKGETLLYTTGERISSIRTLIKRNVAWLNSQRTSGTSYAVWDRFNVYPTVGTPPAFAQISMDYITLFASMYAFNRGSIRFKGVNMSNNEASPFWRFTTFPTAVSNYSPGGTTVDLIYASDPGIEGQSYVSGIPFPTIPHSDSVSVVSEVQIPFYHRTFAVFCHYRPYTTIPTSSTHLPYYEGSNYLGVANTNSLAFNEVLLRSAGDDFQFGYFLGSPIVTDIGNLAVAGSPNYVTNW